MSIDISDVETSRLAIVDEISAIGPSDSEKVNALQLTLMPQFKFNLDTLLSYIRSLDSAVVINNSKSLTEEMNLIFGTMTEEILFVNNLIPGLVSDTDILNYSNLITSAMASDSMAYTILSMVNFLLQSNLISADTQAIALETKATTYLTDRVRILENKALQ